MSFPPTVGRYRIERVLGSGAFASVWLGHDDALDSDVAIKVLSGSLIDDLDVRNRFLEEARILRRADSSRLVRVHDIGELPDGRPYFVMSYADRGTLADRMRERPLPVAQALALAEEIAYGVEVINSLGVIHRDLKPSNVLFQSAPDGGERLLIADLGLAKALAHASGAFTLPVGTPGYMSPEQARFGGGLDVRADVYGLGALTYHMLTGRPPGPPPVRVAPSALRDELTPEFDQVVMRALEVEREKRWPTAGAFAQALSTLRPTITPSASQESRRPPQEASPPPSSRSAPPEAPKTVQDQFYPPPASHSYSQGPGPSASQPSHRPGPPASQPSHGLPPSQAPSGQAPSGQGPSSQGPSSQGPSSQGPGHGYHAPPPPQPPPHRSSGYPEPEPPTCEDAPQGEDSLRTTEMSPPGRGPSQEPRTLVDDQDQTLVDHPSDRFGPPAPPPSQGGTDDGRTISMPAPHLQQGPQGPQAPPGPQGEQSPENGRTAVFPVQGPPGGHGQGPGPDAGGGQGPFAPGFPPPPPVQGGGPSGGGLKERLRKIGLPGRSGAPGGPGGPGGPGAPGGRKNVTPLVIGAGVLAVALVGGLTIGLLSRDDDPPPPKKPAVPKDFVPISDASGKIRTAVPKAWPRGQESTWTPRTVNLNDPVARPVLRATPSVPNFIGDGPSPGVFIGLTTDMTPGKLPPPTAILHGSCTKGATENYTSPDKALTGTITRFTNCQRGTPTVVEVGLRDKSGRFGAWIRVKETDNRNATKDILDNLKLAAP